MGGYRLRDRGSVNDGRFHGQLAEAFQRIGDAVAAKRVPVGRDVGRDDGASQFLFQFLDHVDDAQCSTDVQEGVDVVVIELAEAFERVFQVYLDDVFRLLDL